MSKEIALGYLIDFLSENEPPIKDVVVKRFEPDGNGDFKIEKYTFIGLLKIAYNLKENEQR